MLGACAFARVGRVAASASGWLVGWGNGLAYLVGARLLKGVISLHMRKPPPPPHTARIRTCIRSEQDAGYLVRLQTCAHPQLAHIPASESGYLERGSCGTITHCPASQPPTHLPSQPACQKHHHHTQLPSGHAYPPRARTQLVPFNRRVYAYARVLRIPAPASGYLMGHAYVQVRVFPNTVISQRLSMLPLSTLPLHAPPLHAPSPRTSPFCHHWLSDVCSVVYVPIPPRQTQRRPASGNEQVVTRRCGFDLFCTWIWKARQSVPIVCHGAQTR
jgi:hypothetical protein